VVHTKTIEPLTQKKLVGIGKRKTYEVGLPFFDDLTHGGIGKADYIGVLGPTGGGKTLLSVQLSVQLMLLGKRVLFCNYEQGWAGDVAERFYSVISGFGRELLKNKREDQIEEKVREKIEEMQAVIGDRMVIGNTVGPDGIGRTVLMTLKVF